MNELLNELYCVRQCWFIFGSGSNAGVALSMAETVKRKGPHFSPSLPVAGSSGPAGSPLLPAPSMNQTAGSSRARQGGVSGLKSPLFPYSFESEHRK